MVAWKTPSFAEIKMDAEIGAYQEDGEPSPLANGTRKPSRSAAAPTLSRARSVVATAAFSLLSAALCQCGGSPRDEATGGATSGEAVGITSSALTTASVLTQHNDNARTGANLAETLLTPASVSTQFGYLYDLPVTGLVYGQPLIAANVSIKSSTHPSVMYVATMHNMVYAFDGSATKQTPALLTATLETPTPAQDPIIGGCSALAPGQTYQCPGGPVRNVSNIPDEIGILSTPVIVSNTIYVMTNSGAGTSNHHYLHALDIRTLKDLPGSPQVVTMPGGASFPSSMHVQRSALLAANGMIYATFASYCDQPPYNGWVLGFDATTLKATAAWSSTPNGQAGGIWQAGQGPAADASGYVYVQTGNGDTDLPSGGQNASEAMVRLTPGLKLFDWFVPYNYASLNGGDLDFASGGVLLLPGTNLVLGGGKFSTIYVTKQTSLGHYSPTAPAPAGVQALVVSSSGNEIHGSPVYWNGPSGPHIYVWASNDNVKAFHFNGTTFDPTAAQGTSLASSDNPGAILSLSASGATNGILWAARSLASGSAEFCPLQGRLLALDATNVNKVLWDSSFEVSDPFVFSKNAAPTVANGKVFLSTFSNMVRVYGLGAPGRGFGAPTPWSNTQFYGTLSASTLAGATQVGDVTGDGKADAVAFDGTQTWVMPSNGSGFGAPTLWSSTNFYGTHDAFSTQLADVDGDVKHTADAVAFDGTSAWVMLSNGSSFGPPTQWSSTAFFGTLGSSKIANPVQLGDVNGDGKADAVAFDGTHTWVMLSNGSGFGAPAAWSSTNFYGTHDVYSTHLADVDGDSKHTADAVAFDGTNTWVMLSNGSGFGPPTKWSSAPFYGTFSSAQIADATHVADVNGDGKADAVVFDGNSVWVMLSTGSGFAWPTQWSGSFFYGTHNAFSTQVGDINADGLADAVAFDGGSTWVLLGVR